MYLCKYYDIALIYGKNFKNFLLNFEIFLFFCTQNITFCKLVNIFFLNKIFFGYIFFEKINFFYISKYIF